MKARIRVNPPEPPGWVYEPKWDGFRAIAWGGKEPRMDSRSEKPLLRYFPELQVALDQLQPGMSLVQSGMSRLDQRTLPHAAGAP